MAVLFFAAVAFFAVRFFGISWTVACSPLSPRASFAAWTEAFSVAIKSTICPAGSCSPAGLGGCLPAVLERAVLLSHPNHVEGSKGASAPSSSTITISLSIKLLAPSAGRRGRYE